MKNKPNAEPVCKPDAETLWKQLEDVIVPQLRLSLSDRASDALVSGKLRPEVNRQYPSFRAKRALCAITRLGAIESLRHCPPLAQ